MAGRLSSPRFRRRLLKLSALGLVAGAVAAVTVVFWDTGRDYDTPLSSQPAVVNEAQQSVRLSDGERRAAITAAARFVDTAVKREHVADSYLLASPSLRQGMTRAEWAKGEIPVVPYHVDAARWKTDYTYADEVGLQVYVLPKVGAKVRPMIFHMSVKAYGAGDERRWLVDSWSPRVDGIPAPPTQSSGTFSSLQASLGPAAAPEGKLGTIWLAVPGLLILALLAVPATVLLRERASTRRAERDYAASLAAQERDLS